MKVIKRNGQIVDFEPDTIRQAIFNCFLSIHCEIADVVTEHVFNDVIEELTQQDHDPLSVEEIQDLAEIAMMDEDEHEAAKAFILYRERYKNLDNINDNSTSVYGREC